ncbi:phage tail protein [Streptomyces sp. WZ-12]|uniref:phage tail protein n=1 Tax=Streptomyces sp. WZ-12 TaxID=3030210 RepID=UPI002380F4E5|nr:phage tail protein [Streptomyces sp. WZ-12]
MSDDDFAMSWKFTAGVLGFGFFTRCEGLSCNVEIDEYKEGGFDSFTWKWPTGVRFSNITLSRPFTKQTIPLSWWVSSSGIVPLPTLGEIVASGPDGRVLGSWLLMGVFPVSWKGPSFDAGRVSAAEETLEICHQGFV